MEKTDTQGSCTYKQGSLPECAPLALAQIPAQKSSEPAYKSGEALSRGTLFPGLDLPFKNIVNQMPAETTELRELMALDFVTEELACISIRTLRIPRLLKRSSPSSSSTRRAARNTSPASGLSASLTSRLPRASPG